MLLEPLNVNITLRRLDVFNCNDINVRVQFSRVDVEVRPALECSASAELPPVIRYGDKGERRPGHGEYHVIHRTRRVLSTKERRSNGPRPAGRSRFADVCPEAVVHKPAKGLWLA